MQLLNLLQEQKLLKQHIQNTMKVRTAQGNWGCAYISA